ncbi:amidase family protein [Roseovarius sp. C7]|uniref:amidase family protein n=1 Tax=Roseovarius sp. C7 TaxID=3398643 RepID=UPI0039F5FEE9
MSHDFPWSPDTARSRLDAALAQVEAGEAKCRHVFTQTFAEDARRDAGAAADMSGPLAGALVSIKDLLDVAGHVTRAGTVFLADTAPAGADAEVVARLRDAGAVIMGHTNMTELAYSGLGLNPHYGTPESALYPGCIPGGSSSGGAVSVARGLCDIAIGTDTGGSLRIPAAFNGIVGFKPTQANVSRAGCLALSRSLDSVGPMARSVAHVRLAYEAIRQAEAVAPRPLGRDFVIPENFGMDDLEPAVAAGFEAAVARIEAAGHKVSRARIEALEAMKSLAVWQFSAVESRGEYDAAYQTQRAAFDPRVSSRMARADEADAVAYRQTLNQRAALIEAFEAEMAGRVLLMPTVPILPPSFAAMEDDAEYGRVNLQALRNPTIGNVMDGCAISLPFAHAGDTIGVMMIAGHGRDMALLDLAETCESVLAG